MPAMRLPQALMHLLKPEAYPHPVKNVQVIETSLSWVLLAGDFAYKIKRPVRLPYVDMRSVRRRYQLCRREVRLNRRFAREWYLRVVPITAVDGVAQIAGRGSVIEHAVQMRAFPPSELLSDLVERQDVSFKALADFGHVLARIHDRLAQMRPDAPWCTPQRVRESVLQNWRECADLLPLDEFGELDIELRNSLERRLEEAPDLIQGRRDHGRVRECHGDLHVGNLFRHGGRLIAFDGIEFEPAFRWIDVADEIAFLWMDLQARKAPDLASGFLNAYLAASGDYQACRLLPLYGTHRALVRAKVESAQWAESRNLHGGRAHLRIRDYLAEAHSISGRRVGCLVLVSGLSGSGKTHLSSQLAQSYRALHLRSDLERKRLGGLDELQPSGSQLGSGIYSADMSTKTYGRLCDCAQHALTAGFTTIVDATFLRRSDRHRLRQMAARIGARSVGIHCEAPLPVLRERLEARTARRCDASEAGIEVLESQIEAQETLDDPDLPSIHIDTHAADAARRAGAALEAMLRGASSRR